MFFYLLYIIVVVEGVDEKPSGYTGTA